MRRTVPQIIMLNHAAWKENEEAELRAEARRKQQEKQQAEDNLDPVLSDMGGKRLSEIQENPKLFDSYMNDWSAFA